MSVDIIIKALITLSHIATLDKERIKYFRLILWICGPLFLLTTVLFIAPRINSAAYAQLWIVIVLTEILLGAILPTTKQNSLVHNFFAYLMAIGMFVSVLILIFTQIQYSEVLIVVAILMLIAAILMFIKRNKYVYFELAYIFLSHISVLIAVLSLV